jgi:hypothetical protein
VFLWLLDCFSMG